MRRNPVIADVFTQLDYMEKRGSGLRKMLELTKKLPNFLQGKEPQYQTEATSFHTTFHNLNWGENGRIPVEEVADRVNSTFGKYPIKEESTQTKYTENIKSTQKEYTENIKSTQKNVGRTAQKIIDLVISNPIISQEKMADAIGISIDGVKKQVKKLRGMGILVREGADRGGYWRIIVRPETEQ